MAQYVIRVSEDLSQNANYKQLTDIPAGDLAKIGVDTTVLVYPGTYTAPTGVVLDDVAFVGVGERDEIVINGDMTIANTSANVTTFENLHFVGSDANAAAGAACVTKLGAAYNTLRFKNVKFSNAEHAVSQNAERAFTTTNKSLFMDFCDAGEVDQAVVSNSNVEINYSIMNTGSNAYFTPGTGGGHADLVVTVRLSTSGGSNVGLNTETVLAAIS